MRKQQRAVVLKTSVQDSFRRRPHHCAVRRVKGSDTSVYVLLYMLDGVESDVTGSAYHPAEGRPRSGCPRCALCAAEGGR